MNDPNTTTSTRLCARAITAVCALGLGGVCSAQTLAIDWYAIGQSGDVALSGGDLEVRGSAGLSVASEQLRGGMLGLSGGFWSLPASPTTNAITAEASVAGPGRILVRWSSTKDDVPFYRISRAVGTSSSAVELATIRGGRAGDYSYLDAVVSADTEYRYLISEVHSPGPILPRVTAIGRAYGATMPPGIVRVGPAQAYKTIDAAIAAAGASLPHFTITVDPGTYAPFTVDGAAHRELHIVADGTGPVLIDTRDGPVTIRGRNLLQSVELRGLRIGNLGSAHSALRIEQCAGAVVLDEVEVQGGRGRPGVEVFASTGVALQACEVSGVQGLVLDQSASVYASLGSLNSIDVRGTSSLTLCELVPGGSSVEAGSTRTDLVGVMPVLRTAPFVPTGQNIVVDVKSVPFSAFAAVLSSGRLWFEIPGIEMPLIASVPGLILTLSGAVGATGDGQIVLPTPPGLEGLKLQFQALSISPSQPFRFSTLTSMSIVRAR